MSAQHTQGCGSFTCMGHGDNAVCGQLHYRGIYICDSCKAKATASQLAAARALLQELLDNSQAFPGALEMLDLDGMEWAGRARAFLKAVQL